MALSEVSIAACASDDGVFELLSAELTARLGPGDHDDLDAFVARTQSLPVGLRAMAMTYQLDVSLALDDLGWHFANWHHRNYCDATQWALGELEATEEAALFAQAYAIAQSHWDRIGDLLHQGDKAFVDWYSKSDYEKQTMPLSRRMWDLQKTGGIFAHWMSYARKWPGRVVTG